MVAITGSLIVQVFVFLALIWFTKAFLWGPLMNVLEERRVRVADGLAAGERGERKLEEARQETEKMLQDTREQVQQILANANQQAEDIVEQARQEARSEGERLLESARSEIQLEVNSAREKLRHDMTGLALGAAEKIVQREIDARAHEDLLEKAVQEL